MSRTDILGLFRLSPNAISRMQRGVCAGMSNISVNSTHFSTTATTRVAAIALAVGTNADDGLAALKAVLCPLPESFPAVILVAMHQKSVEDENLVEILNDCTALTVREAWSGDKIQAGFVYTAPRNYHLVVTAFNVVWLTVDPPEHSLRPAADPLFRSVAQIYGERAIGVVLTGEDGDGAAGIKSIKQAGGSTISQDETTSANPSMPCSAIATGRVDLILPLSHIAGALVHLVSAKKSGDLDSR